MEGLLATRVNLLVRRVDHPDPGAGACSRSAPTRPGAGLSQVVLSFGMPFVLVPLVRLTGDRNLMGADVNHRVTTLLAWVVAGLIILLNVALLYLTFA